MGLRWSGYYDSAQFFSKLEYFPQIGHAADIRREAPRALLPPAC